MQDWGYFLYSLLELFSSDYYSNKISLTFKYCCRLGAQICNSILFCSAGDRLVTGILTSL